MAATFVSKWLRGDFRKPWDQPDKTDKTNSVSSVSPILDNAETFIDIDDAATWPPYVRRIEAIARQQFGHEAARRQVIAEIAFLNGEGREDGWVVVDSRVGVGKDDWQTR